MVCICVALTQPSGLRLDYFLGAAGICTALSFALYLRDGIHQLSAHESARPQSRDVASPPSPKDNDAMHNR